MFPVVQDKVLYKYYILLLAVCYCYIELCHDFSFDSLYGSNEIYTLLSWKELMPIGCVLLTINISMANIRLMFGL